MSVTQKHPQAGIAAIAAVLLIAAIGVIGFVGWNVYQNNQDKTQSTADSTQTVVKPTVSKPAEPATFAYSKVPAELQKAILQYTTAKAPECVVNGKIVDIDKKSVDQDVRYAASGSAATGIGCDGSSMMTLFIKQSAGDWKEVDSTQFGFSCDMLKTNHIPVALLEFNGAGSAQCSDGTTGLVTYKL